MNKYVGLKTRKMCKKFNFSGFVWWLCKYLFSRNVHLFLSNMSFIGVSHSGWPFSCEVLAHDVMYTSAPQASIVHDQFVMPLHLQWP